MKTHFILARDLPDAFFQVCDIVLKHGRTWVINKGSYEGQNRLDLDYTVIEVTHPCTRPLVPEMPMHMQHIPPPATMEYVEEYMPYLMCSKKKEGEQYTYGERLEWQIEDVIRNYRTKGFGSNQECMSVSMPPDIVMEDPPCLRSIDTKIVPNKHGEMELCLYPYFRSNDLWNGFPVNLASLALLLEYMADSIGVKTGSILYSSKSLHLYDHVWEIAADFVGNKRKD